MAGIDYLQQTLGLPLQAAKAAAALLAAVLVLAGRRLLAAACAVVLLVDMVVPPLVGSLHVRPMNSRSRNRTSNATSKPRALPTRWIAALLSSTFPPPKIRGSISSQQAAAR
jgi:hypothetical protein